MSGSLIVEYAGGLVGYNDSYIENCYSTGSVQGTDYVGGLLGGNTSIVSNCFSTGSVTGNNNVGGFVGGGNAPVSPVEVNNCYWDTETSGQLISIAGGTGLTSALMKIQGSYSGWDFGGTWSINASTNGGYPYLSWQTFSSAIIANIKVFLQGPFSSGSMTTSISSLIPINSETAYDSTTYGYASKSASNIPANAVDWVLVELRTGTSAATKVETEAGLLKSDGTIADADGISALRFTASAAGSYYVVIRHRNHLAIMSASTVSLSATSALYDFTTAQSQAYGTNPMASLSGGVFGLYAGDSNTDGQITALDFNTWNANTKAGQVGYVPDDMNLDGQVTALDFNPWNVNTKLGATTQVP